MFSKWYIWNVPHKAALYFERLLSDQPPPSSQTEPLVSPRGVRGHTERPFDSTNTNCIQTNKPGGGGIQKQDFTAVSRNNNLGFSAPSNWINLKCLIVLYICIISCILEGYSLPQPAQANPSPWQPCHQSWEGFPGSSRSACQTWRTPSLSCPAHTHTHTHTHTHI